MSTELERTPHPREREVFLEALGHHPGPERAEYLAVACGNDSELRGRVEGLLRDAEDTGEFLVTPAVVLGEELSSGWEELDRGGMEARASEKAGDRIGRYRLVAPLGEGGCGVVFLAEQEEPVRREVALKVIRAGMDSRRVIARFEAERQTLALMDHPGIARVLDAGATEGGRPYFVMELVRGVRITEYCARRAPTVGERLRLFIEVCGAVQHAHQKGVIHRDLKPSNILVSESGARPAVKVIDFGVAKAMDGDLAVQAQRTEFHALIGTPAYMSPEQAAMGGIDVDTRSDIYALGAVLYELLTGVTPFDGEVLLRAGLDECRRMIREQEPIRPSIRVALRFSGDTGGRGAGVAPASVQALEGDLDWIVMKCLEKDRSRRYESADALVLDLHRHLAHEPVLARPPGAWYRAGKFLRRNRLAVGAAAAVAAAILAGSGVSVYQAVRARAAEEQESRLRQLAEKESQRARREEGVARLNEYVADINLAQRSLDDGNYAKASRLLGKHRPAAGRTDLRGFEWRHLWEQSLGDARFSYPPEQASVLSVGVSPDGRWVAVGTRDRVTVRESAGGAQVASLDGGAYSLAFTPDSARLVAGNGPSVRVWRVEDWTAETALAEAWSPVAVATAGDLLVTAGGRDRVLVWDTASWKTVAELPGASAPVAVAPDGRMVATDSRDGITLWSLPSGRVVGRLENAAGLFVHKGGPWFREDRAMVFSADGARLMAARNRPSPRGVYVLGVWDVASGAEIGTFPPASEASRHSGVIAAVALSADGGRLVTGAWDHSVRLWEPDTGRAVGTLHGHMAEVWSVAFAPVGGMVISGAKDGEVYRWPPTRPQVDPVLVHGAAVPLAFSADGRRLAVIRAPASLALLDAATGDLQEEFPLARPRGPGPRSVAIDQGFLRLAEVADGGRLRIRDLARGGATIEGGEVAGVVDVAMSPDGRVLMLRREGGVWEWWENGTPSAPLPEVGVERVFFSGDGSTLAAISSQRTVRCWDVVRRAPLGVVKLPEGLALGVVLSWDGRLLASTTSPGEVDNLIQLWDTRTGGQVGTCAGHKQGIMSVAFAPDGRTLASSSSDSTIRLWNVATQQELLSVQRLADPPWRLMFSPDGTRLIGDSQLEGPGGSVRVILHAPRMDAVHGAGPKPTIQWKDPDGPHAEQARRPRTKGGVWDAVPARDERSGAPPRRLKHLISSALRVRVRPGSPSWNRWLARRSRGGRRPASGVSG